MSIDVRLVKAPIVRLFRGALGRDPDADELARAGARLRAGEPLQAIAQDLMASPGCLDPGWPADATPADRLVAWADSTAARASVALLPAVIPHAAPDDPTAYRLWLDDYDQPPADPPKLAGGQVALAMLAGDTTAEAALASVASLRAQIHPHWSLAVVTPVLISPWARAALAALPAQDARITLVEAGATASRADALNPALAAVDSDYVAILEPGDRLPPTALYEIVAAFQADPAARMIFTDEDVMDAAGRRLPRFKPGYSPAADPALDLIGQLAVYRRDLWRQAGGLRDDEDEDLRARAATLAGDGGPRHLAAILCHRAGSRAQALPAARPGQPPPGPWPRVSVIIPTRDRAALLAACTDGLLHRTDYPDLEIIVVDNDSTEPDARALLDTLGRRPQVRVLAHPGGFNFAAMNNAAAAIAQGEVLLLLNNDTDILHPDWLARMVDHAMRPDVGAVGAKLLYPDGTVQHAGILLGPDGSATHVGRHAPGDAPGYLGQFACTRDLSAVTGACLAIRRVVFERLGGMNERLAVTWNDIDLCLRVRAAGLRVIWTPQARLIHAEGASRGADADDPARHRRFLDEQALMRRIWGDRLRDDPFLNPNLLASEAGFLVLTRPRQPRPWRRAACA
jgi:GT2 family glycosyltransferase